MKLFDDIAPAHKLHPIFKLLSLPPYAAERAVLEEWTNGFVDRDGKFQYEFQTTFESCLWELYLCACLREFGADVDFSFSSPDFVAAIGDQQFCIEATIAAPSAGGKSPYGDLGADIPEDFNRFNSEATLRICNSFSSKVRKYREAYSALPQVQGVPFVIAIASFDRPYAHMSASRPVLSALYGLYYDEELTIATRAKNIISYNVSGVSKNENADVPLGHFLDESYTDISAVIYSSLATWGKVRALADNSQAKSVYTTFHPNEDGIRPIIRQAAKSEYKEHLIDGLYVFHNPFAQRAIARSTFNHPRIAQFFIKPDGELDVVAPDNFLLVRFIQTVNVGSELRDIFAQQGTQAAGPASGGSAA